VGCGLFIPGGRGYAVSGISTGQHARGIGTTPPSPPPQASSQNVVTGGLSGLNTAKSCLKAGGSFHRLFILRL